ncbi:HotDog domain-containing protein [Daldinia decipiens]|uniref:HotDog domain-containing protein n=1 Tax=Daldinia decipiens TaxID=326647 RepID=UPI0020C386B4|nr:HotDog domain-containing protein [Daldinia decipiens]KAI1658539.1 HotDog domain-containing protein [Daldinia decipiens]
MSSSSSSSPASNPADPATKPAEHNQVVADPLAHFKAIPWCAALLSDPAILEIGVPDRRPLPNGGSSLIRKTMNTPTTARACVTFYQLVKPVKPVKPRSSSSSSPSFAGTGEVSPVGAGASAPSGSTKSSRSSKGENKGKKQKKALSASEALLSGGGKQNGEDPRNPFVLFSALVDLGDGCQSFPGIMHGGMHGLLMDEVMGTVANSQSANSAYTVRFTTHYHRAIRLPQILLVRGRVVRKEGRKIYARGTLEDKNGNVMAEGDGVWLAIERRSGQSKL